jgi:hypothetical protein
MQAVVAFRGKRERKLRLVLGAIGSRVSRRILLTWTRLLQMRYYKSLMHPLYVVFGGMTMIVIVVGIPSLLLYWAARSALLLYGKPTTINATLDRDYQVFFHLFAIKPSKTSVIA